MTAARNAGQPKDMAGERVNIMKPFLISTTIREQAQRRQSEERTTSRTSNSTTNPKMNIDFYIFVI